MLQSAMATWQYPSTITLSLPACPVQASIHVPGSKSITNRALLLAALADGESRLLGPLHSEDTLYMTEALRHLGVTIAKESNGDLVVQGVNGAFSYPSGPLFIGNSGTTVRFLTAAAALAPEGATVELDGVERMRERPIADLLDALMQLGVYAKAVSGTGCPPVHIHGGGIPGGRCGLRGNVSSQYLSALLQAAPYAESDVDILIIGDLISKPYVDITQSVMRSFGVEMENENYETLRVRAGQQYTAREYAIEADASNATYFLAAAAITGGTVTLENLGAGSIQGDVKFAEVLRSMGCGVEMGDKITVQGPKSLTAVDVDMTAIPDTAQTLAVLCAFADGQSRITGISSLRVKETDRVAAIATELRKLGATVVEGTDTWMITPPTGEIPAVSIDTYDDHRMAMSFAVATLKSDRITINNPGCVAKTFPDFWDKWTAAFNQSAGA